MTAEWRKNERWRAQAAAEAAKLPATLQPISAAEILAHERTAPPGYRSPTRAWRSRFFIVQEFLEQPPVLARLSINRSAVLPNGRWADGISWDVLQALKSEVGWGKHDAVEVYPADADVVDVANIRHLWIMAEPLTFKWRGP